MKHKIISALSVTLLLFLFSFSEIKAGGCTYSFKVNSTPIYWNDTVTAVCGTTTTVTIYICCCTGPQAPASAFSLTRNGVPINAPFTANNFNNEYTSIIWQEGSYKVMLTGSTYSACAFYLDYDCIPITPPTDSTENTEQPAGSISETNNYTSIKAYSINGQLLLNENNISYADAVTLLSAFSNQILILVLQNESGTETKKLVLQQ